MNTEKRAVRRIEIETLYQGLETFFQEEKQQIAYAKFGESFELALQEVVPNAILIPVITPGYSDNYFMRKKGYAVLGFFPLCLENSLSGIHGNNEYISISSMKIAYKIFSKIILHYILTF